MTAHCWVQHRCFPKWYGDSVKGLKLNQEQVECILSTPFGHFLNFPYMYVDNQLLDDLCMSFLGNQTFKIGDVAVQLTIEHIVQILGVPNGTLEIKGKDDKIVEGNTFKKRIFGDEKITIKRDDIVAKLHKLIEEKQNNTSDIVKLWILLLFATLLFPQSGYTLSSNLIGYVEDGDGLERYNWAEAILRKIFANMAKCSDVVKKRKQGERASVYLTGCTMALCVSINSIK